MAHLTVNPTVPGILDFNTKVKDIVDHIDPELGTQRTTLRNSKSKQYSETLVPMYLVIRYPYAYDTKVKGVDYNFVPSIRFDINPNEMTIEYEKNINKTLTGGGWFEEYWRDNLSVMNARGSTGAFLHKDYGITTVSRSDTRQYQIFVALVRFYQENGHIYSPSGAILLRGHIELFYGDSRYLGYFENFTFTESALNPFRFEYTFTYRIERENTFSKIPGSYNQGTKNNLAENFNTVSSKLNANKSYRQWYDNSR